MDDDYSLLPEPFREIAANAWQRERFTNRMISGVAIVGGIVLAIAVLAYALPRNRSVRTSEFATVGVALAFVVGGVWLFRQTLGEHPLLRAIRTARVVWLYKNRTGGRTRFVIATDDGTSFGMAYMPNKPPDQYTPEEKAREDQLFVAAKRAFPDAHVGYSTASLQRFARDPKTFLEQS